MSNNISIINTASLIIIFLHFSNILNIHATEYDELTSDIAVKLKPEFADDLVSELFATTHDLTKVARVSQH
jgi:hypothetical protein